MKIQLKSIYNFRKTTELLDHLQEEEEDTALTEQPS